MKNIRFHLAAAAAVCLIAVASCGGNKDCKEGDISFDTFSFSTLAKGTDTDSIKAEFEDFSGVWKVASQGMLPVKVGDNDLTALRDTLCALARIRIDEEKNISARLPEYLKDSQEKLDSAAARSLLVNRVSLELLTPEVMVFEVYTYQYPEGAAHGGYANNYVNYGLKSGKVLSLADLLTAGYEPKLEAMVREKIAGRDDLIVEPEEVKVPANYRFTDEGLTLIFPLYEITPYSSGEPEVDFNIGELRDILTPEALEMFK